MWFLGRYDPLLHHRRRPVRIIRGDQVTPVVVTYHFRSNLARAREGVGVGCAYDGRPAAVVVVTRAAVRFVGEGRDAAVVVKATGDYWRAWGAVVTSVDVTPEDPVDDARGARFLPVGVVAVVVSAPCAVVLDGGEPREAVGAALVEEAALVIVVNGVVYVVPEPVHFPGNGKRKQA